MPEVLVTQPEDGSTADVADINSQVNAILAVLNGHLDGDNIEPNSLPWSVMETFTDTIPASAMQDSANLELFRSHANLSLVGDGCEWAIISGLNATMTEGTIYAPTGALGAVDAIASKTFTASKDTYVSVSPAGVVTYQETTNGGTQPTLGTNYLWLAKVVTDGSAVTAIHDMSVRGNEIARFKLGAASDRITLDGIPEVKHMRVVINLIATGGTINTALQFNGDTSTNYASRKDDDGVTDTDVSTTNVGLEIGSLADTGTLFAILDIINIANQKKQYFYSCTNDAAASSATAPSNTLGSGKWTNATDLIDQIDIYNIGTGDFAANSEVLVLDMRK